MVVSSKKVGGSGVTSTVGTWYGDVVMGALLSQKQNIIVFAANNSRCCECHVAPTILL